jgi:hypothetical protein
MTAAIQTIEQADVEAQGFASDILFWALDNNAALAEAANLVITASRSGSFTAAAEPAAAAVHKLFPLLDTLPSVTGDVSAKSLPTAEELDAVKTKTMANVVDWIKLIQTLKTLWPLIEQLLKLRDAAPAA